MLVLRRIRVAFTLKGVPAEKLVAAQRAHEVFKEKCPIYRSIHRAVDITTELTIV